VVILMVDYRDGGYPYGGLPLWWIIVFLAFVVFFIYS